MYATTGIQDIIGISANEMQGRSFYYCIAENCLRDATKCLENAKGNDSIAYLRFWFRDPRQDDAVAPPDDDSDEEMTTDASLDNSEGGIGLASGSETSPDTTMGADVMEIDSGAEGSKHGSHESHGSSGESTADTHEAVFGEPAQANSSASSTGPSPERSRSGSQPQNGDAIELEAVVSCTSDGLVVCLRKARPMIPHPTHRPSKPVYENGLYAAPWASTPHLPPVMDRPGAGFGTAFAPALGPYGAQHSHTPPPRSLEQNDFMNAIRDQAIFAWALTGINGSLADFGQGKPLGESLPQDGLPVWVSDNRSGSDRAAGHIFGDPGIPRNNGSGSGSGSVSRSSASGSGSGGIPTPYPGPA